MNFSSIINSILYRWVDVGLDKSGAGLILREWNDDLNLVQDCCFVSMGVLGRYTVHNVVHNE